MTTQLQEVNQPLIYNDVEIPQKNEMISLTGAWKAAGSPVNKEPYNWSRFEGAAFVQAVSMAHNLSVTQVMTKKRGKGGATFAHWQIGLAYAKYLDHDFHMWCNTVVRERMESPHRPVVSAETLEQIERGFGIMRMLAHKVTEIEKTVALIGNPDPRIGPATEYQTSKEVMEDYGFKRGEIRGRAGQLSTRLRRFSMEHGHPLRLASETKRHLFHVDAVRAWLDSGGGRNWLTGKLVEVRSKEARQGHLKLVGKPSV